jgi:diamine N-acetyltransferase
MILETEKIRLELTNPDNIPKIIKIESDNSEFVGQYDTKKHKDVIDDDDGLHLSIIEKSNSSLIGYIILAGLTNTNDSIEFRRIVVSEKGKGFGKDSLILVKKYCFENLNAHRIWLDVYEDNFRAIQLYKSQGFSIDGILTCIIHKPQM